MAMSPRVAQRSTARSQSALKRLPVGSPPVPMYSWPSVSAIWQFALKVAIAASVSVPGMVPWLPFASRPFASRIARISAGVIWRPRIAVLWL